MIREPGATPGEVRKFGIMFSGICLAVVAFLLFKGSQHWPWFGVAAGFFLVAGLVGYRILRPIYVGWMRFSFLLGWINTRLVLGIFFYLILTPIGLLLRLLGRDLLDKRIEPEATSYWKKRTFPSSPQTMERQF